MPTGVISAWKALYRVLRGGRQRPSRSVDRKSAGRNESEGIEPRQILENVGAETLLFVRRQHRKPKGGRAHRGPSPQHALKVKWGTQETLVELKGIEVFDQERKLKTTHTLDKGVRSLHSSEEVR